MYYGWIVVAAFGKNNYTRDGRKEDAVTVGTGPHSVRVLCLYHVIVVDSGSLSLDAVPVCGNPRLFLWQLDTSCGCTNRQLFRIEEPRNITGNYPNWFGGRDNRPHTGCIVHDKTGDYSSAFVMCSISFFLAAVVTFSIKTAGDNRG